MKRLFFAIPLPEDLKRKILQSFPRKNFPGIRFSAEENLHITSHFLGATEEERVPQIILEAKQIADSTFPFELKFESFKTIFKERKPVMIWVQLKENAAFENLSLALRKSFPTDEKRKPNPHLTLARIKQLKKLPFDLPVMNSFSFAADQLELFESVTHPEGSKYHLIESWKLNSS